MPAQIATGEDGAPQHIELADDTTSPRTDCEPGPGLRNSKGWDGKLRVPKNALLANPEALSDPEYSDDENVHPGDEISADEGQYCCTPQIHSLADAPY